MALKSPDPGQFVQDVQVNGLPYHQFEHWWSTIRAGDRINLKRDKSNIHDARAVKVCWGHHQVGWVPKSTNQRIAQLMDAGDGLYAVVKDVGRDRLAIQVFHEAPLKAQPPYRLTNLQFSESGRRLRPEAWVNGTQFAARSKPERTSITLNDPDFPDRDLYWFRKKDLPHSSVADMLADGRLVVVKRGGTLVIEAAPAPNPPEWTDGPSHHEIAFAQGLSSTGRLNKTEPNQQYIQPTTEKGNTMSLSSQTTSLINNNKNAATQAGYLEAGRIANNQVVKLASKAMPVMVRGYADTAVGKLVIANIAQMAAAQLRPNDPTLAKLTGAMTVAAYQEVIQTVDIEGWLDELLASPGIKRAVEKMNAADGPARTLADQE